MSKKAEMMTQCKMRCGNKIDVAWVDSSAARVGVQIDFKDIEGRWTITEVWTSMPATEVQARSRDFAHQREASDV